MSTWLLMLLILFPSLSFAKERSRVKESLQQVLKSPDFVELKPHRNLALDLRYASTNNFVGKDMYGDFNRAFLHRVAGEKLEMAMGELQQLKPGFKLFIFDALRPRAVQQILWDKVVGTDQQGYVGNPQKGSIHNYGMAVDLSIQDDQGRELDMGTPFDDFTLLSQPKHEKENLLAGKLSPRQIENRHLLRKVMVDSGFIQLPHEWWHYDALPGEKVRANYKIVE